MKQKNSEYVEENTFTKKELLKLSSRPLEMQYQTMITNILKAISITNGDIMLCFSGGKDSALLMDVYCECAAMMGIKNVFVGYANTTNETTAMRKFVPYFLERCKSRYGVKVELNEVRPKDNLTFVKVIREKGIPFISKSTAGAIRKTKKSMAEANVTYEDVIKYVKPEIKSRDALREMGLNDTAVLSLTGWSCQSQMFGTCFKIAKMWLPFLNFEGEISEECCVILKESPLKMLTYKNIMTGEQANESKFREATWLKHGCNYKLPNGDFKSKPLSTLSKQAVLYGIYHRGIPVCADYGKVVCDGECYKCTDAQRTGCALCGFGIKFDPNRFVRLQKTEEAKVNWAFKPKSQGGAGYLEACEFANEYCGQKIIIPTI